MDSGRTWRKMVRIYHVAYYFWVIVFFSLLLSKVIFFFLFDKLRNALLIILPNLLKFLITLKCILWFYHKKIKRSIFEESGEQHHHSIVFGFDIIFLHLKFTAFMSPIWWIGQRTGLVDIETKYNWFYYVRALKITRIGLFLDTQPIIRKKLISRRL